MKNPKIISTSDLSLGRFTITMDTLQTDGAPFPYSYVHIKEGVVILALYHSRIILIKQYRHAMKEWLYELPAGMVDVSESPLEAGRRELVEETGYIPTDMISLGTYYPSPGSTTEKIHLYCTICDERKDAEPEDTEQIEVLTVAVEEFEQMIHNNSFLHSGGIVAYYKYLLKKQSHEIE
jgi:ADP-ribose pyrophosphatase